MYRVQSVTWQRPSFTQDSLGQRVPSLASQGTLACSISQLTGSYQQGNSLLYPTATHLALTTSTAVQVGDVLGGVYRVAWINAETRQTQLMLEAYHA